MKKKKEIKYNEKNRIMRKIVLTIVSTLILLGLSTYAMSCEEWNISCYIGEKSNVNNAELPYITVVTPNGGENWTRETTKTIKWSYTGDVGPYIKIELLKGGILNRVIASNTRTASKYYNWFIPSVQEIGNNYKIRITSNNNLAYTDTSNNNFIINSVISSSSLSKFVDHIKAIPLGGNNKFPIYIDQSTKQWAYTQVRNSWTAGFYPALLWWVYGKTGKQEDLIHATDMTNAYLALDNAGWDSHDQYTAALPYIKGLKYVNNVNWKNKALQHANRLVDVQFNPTINAITTSTTNNEVIVDSMTTASPLLIWAYKQINDNKYLNKLYSHTSIVIRDHFKNRNKNGAVWQGVSYNTNGIVRSKWNRQTEDNNNKNITWARGQAWMMYGLAELYELTHDDKYKVAFGDVAKFWISSLHTYGDNGVMKNSIGMITGKYDTSGTAIATVALFKMYRLTGSSNIVWLNAAGLSYNRLISDNYMVNGKLIHGYYYDNINDTEVIWGDYFLSEMFDIKS